MDKIVKLNSGLTLAVTSMKKTRALAVGIFVGAGSINEDAENNGISHFIEHMLFKGTKTRNAYQIADEMESIGANINAFTSKMLTAYYTVSTDEYAEECIDILSDIYLNATFTGENLEREKTVVYEEINMTEDDGEDLAFELLNKAHFKDTPLAKPILGTVETVKKMDKAMILDYMGKYYTANNTVVVIVGNIEEDKAKALVEKYLDKYIKKGGIERIEVPPAELLSQYIEKNKPIEQSNIGLSFPCVKKNDPREKALLLLTNIVGGSMSSRLFQEVREKLGLVYSIYSSPLLYENDGYFVIFLATNPSYVEKAIKAIKKVIIELKKNGITEKEFKKGKAQLLSKLVLASESSAAIMRANGKSMIMTEEVFDLDKEIERIEQTTLKDVEEMIDIIFKIDKASASYVGKEVYVDILKTLQG